VVADRAYAVCERLARAHYENFPVASVLLPRAMRPHVAAVYAFARTADDFADEGDRPPDQRLALLDDWQHRLDDAVAGRVPDDGSDAAAIFTAVAATIASCRLDPALFSNLLSAFRQDVTTTRYETWTDLKDYCRRSANPVGRLVLQIAGYRDPLLEVQSDLVCTALQLANHWQDYAIDWRRGRLYVPLEFVREAGADLADLDRRQITPAWRAMWTRTVGATRELFDEGRAVADGVNGRLKWELRATWLGGRRILDRFEAQGFDVYAHRPKLGASDAVAIGVGALTWRATSPR
jgi:phytoene synthase